MCGRLLSESLSQSKDADKKAVKHGLGCFESALTGTYSLLPLSFCGLHPVAADMFSKLLLSEVAYHWKPSSPGHTTWVPTILTHTHSIYYYKKSKGWWKTVCKIPKMREASGPLLTFILQPLEDPSSTASPLIQLFFDLFKHVLHLP